MSASGSFALDVTQRDAWVVQIGILQTVLRPYADRGWVYFEYAIPRLGKRIDAVVLIDHVLFVLEFKVGETEYASSGLDQVCDYALDLKNFHETSHQLIVVPVLIATAAPDSRLGSISLHDDRLGRPICTNADGIARVLETVLTRTTGTAIDAGAWSSGRYCPTPTIIEAATALYAGHSVADISRSDAGATNLTRTSKAVSESIREARENRRKVICFLTGVPGAGKTLVGLNIATEHMEKDSELYSVFLSGNGPLVSVLREALARDRVRREGELGRKLRKGVAASEVRAFIQNVHHFRDECLVDAARPPVEHVALFDEAQRAWNLQQTAKFMLQKKKRPGFQQSEPEFLISCMDRHPDWAVIVCVVGGGQEINTGEAGIGEWIASLRRSFSHWQIRLSSRLHDEEYGAGQILAQLSTHRNVVVQDELHLGVSLRSFRAENISLLVKQMLDLDPNHAAETLRHVSKQYPLAITRSLQRAKQWIRNHARGTERYGIVVSSEAQRLKPHAIDVRSPMDPVHWFLDGKDDVRSSYYMEDVATEFHVQGLEVDWACVTWDADFRYRGNGWEHWSFCGDRWNHIRNADRRTYQKNAYRVLLTRARQSMIIVVPEGDSSDPTRKAEFYDPTFAYLQRIGFAAI